VVDIITASRPLRTFLFKPTKLTNGVVGLSFVTFNESINKIYHEATQVGAPDSISGHFMWNFIWTNWYWDTFITKYYCFPLSVIHAHISFIYHRRYTIISAT